MTVLFLDVRAAAAAVSMSPRWIREQLRTGLPCLRTEGKILICPDALKKWMTSRYTPPPVDLAEAHRIADALTTPRRRAGGAR